MAHEQTKREVKKILDGMKNIDTSGITRKDGTLDVKKFNRLPKVREAVDKIKRLGWNRSILMNNFFTAEMVFIFDFPEDKVCPRCKKNKLEAEEVKNVLSRRDNKTYICSECGRDEARFDFVRSKGEKTPEDIKEDAAWLNGK